MTSATVRSRIWGAEIEALVLGVADRSHVICVCGGRLDHVAVIGEHEVVLREIVLVDAFQEHRSLAGFDIPADQHAGFGVVELKILRKKVHDGKMIEHAGTGGKIGDDIVSAGGRYGEGITSRPPGKDVVSGPTFKVSVADALVQIVVAAAPTKGVIGPAPMRASLPLPPSR